MGKQKVIIMVGLPGCGKSTWLKSHAAEAVIISPDSIRKDILGHQFHLDAEPLIWWMSESMAKLILSQGMSIAIDATNIFPFVRSKWVAIADKYGASKEIVWMDISPDECWMRNVSRKKGDRVPREAFDRMVTAFIPPCNLESVEMGFKIKRIVGKKGRKS